MPISRERRLAGASEVIFGCLESFLALGAVRAKESMAMVEERCPGRRKGTVVGDVRGVPVAIRDPYIEYDGARSKGRLVGSEVCRDDRREGLAFLAHIERQVVQIA